MNTRDIWQNIRNQIHEEFFENLIPFWTCTAKPRNSMVPFLTDFPGLITNDNTVDFQASRGLVMYARLLWSFAAFSRVIPDPILYKLASGALHGLQDVFYDKNNGGYFWLSDGGNKIIDTRKVVYGEAFALYALSETVLADFPDDSENTAGLSVEEIRELADKQFDLLEKHALDKENGGYYEILKENWDIEPLGTLSDEDIPCFKSMNTNLHVLEAYTNYHRIRGDEVSGNALESLILWFIDTIYDKERGHLKLYLNEHGESLKDIDSYGHDIEASWLIQEAAEVIGKKDLLDSIRPVVTALAEAVLQEGFSLPGGGLDNELTGFSSESIHRDTCRIWWVQAEALVGCRTLFELTGDEKWTNQALKICNHIITKQKNHQYGEWFWAVDEKGVPDETKEKAGLWKTPYHNGRCSLEILKRIQGINTKGDWDE